MTEQAPQQAPQATPPPQPNWIQPTPGPAPGIAYASPGSRLIAYVVDLIVVGIVIFIAMAIVGALVLGALAATTDPGAAVAGIFVNILLAIVISIGYFPFFWARSGATPGMRLLHIKVVREVDGGPLSAGTAILRLIGYYVSGLVMYLGYIWILFDAHRQGWHDKLAGTVVIEG